MTDKIRDEDILISKLLSVIEEFGVDMRQAAKIPESLERLMPPGEWKGHVERGWRPQRRAGRGNYTPRL